MRRTWIKEDEEYLRDNYRKISYREMAAHLGRSPKAVRSRAKFLKITKSRAWPAEHVQSVRELYSDTETKVIADKIGRKVEDIYRMADTLGLRKSEEYLAEKRKLEAQRLRESGKAHRFSKGQSPPNKGLRRPGWHRGRMRETQFKKGVRQGLAVKLYQPIGTERFSKEGYLERKVNDDLPLQGRWKAVHRIIWEEANGPIPKGKKIRFKDGDKQNISLENLELVTSAEMMKRNTLHNYPAPVKEAIHVLAGFRRKLNRYGKKQDRRSPEHAVRDDGAVA